MMVVLMSLLVACGTVTRPTCDQTTREVDDDEDLGAIGATVAELTAGLDVPTVVDLRDSAGGLHSTEVSATRAAGPATFTDGTKGVLITPTLGFGSYYLAVGVMCDDTVTFAMDLRLVSDDGVVDVAGPATATTGRISFDSVPLSIERQLDLEEDVIPPPSVPSNVATMEVTYDEDVLLSVYGVHQVPPDDEVAVEWP
jgi:hypothetical protein